MSIRFEYLLSVLENYIYEKMSHQITYNIDFSLSGGCFGTDIIQKCTKWSQIGVHGLTKMTDLRKNSMRVFFDAKQYGKMITWSKQNTTMYFFVKKNL